MKTYTHREFLIPGNTENYLEITVHLDRQSVPNMTSTFLTSVKLVKKNADFSTKAYNYEDTCTLYIDGKQTHQIRAYFGSAVDETYYLVNNYSMTKVHDVDDNGVYDSPSGTLSVNFRYTIDLGGYYETYDKDGNVAATGKMVPVDTEFTVTFPTIEQDKAIIIKAPETYDRDNYMFEYSAAIGEVTTWFTLSYGNFDYYEFAPQTIHHDDFENGIFVFEISEQELKNIRAEFYDTDIAKGRLYLKTGVVSGTTDQMEYKQDMVEFTYHIQDEYPTVENIVIRDVQSTILGLTGDENIIVNGESMIEFSYEPVAYKEAVIVANSISDGKQTISDVTYSVMDNPVNGTFTFTVEDSRGLVTKTKITKPFVNYVRPTITQKLGTVFTGETGVALEVTLTGNYYKGSFGAVENDLVIMCKTKSEVWFEVTDYRATFSNNKYKITFTIDEGYAYGDTIKCQTVFKDTLYRVTSTADSVNTEPVFDWGEDDFNFNVPIKMNGDTILRHNAEANNTVLAASGNRIYLRPGGDEDTYGEVVINNDGSVSLLGVTIDSIGDHVIEIGETSMGTNGTWYWRKWASGRSEAWGMRNMGKMAVSTAWGALYRSDTFNLGYPYTCFSKTPSIQLSPQPAYDGYNTAAVGWIAEYNGSHVWVSPVATNLPSSYIGVYCQGIWTMD